MTSYSTHTRYRHRYTEELNLSPWTNYRFRVRAENKIGVGKASKPTTSWISTPAARPETYPKNVKGVAISTNKIKITFDRLPEIEENGPNVDYVVYYKAVGRSYRMIKKTVTGEKNHIILNFNMLDSYYRLYEFQVQARNEIGHGPRSPIHTAYTGARKPLVVPQNLDIKTKPPTAFIEATWDGVSKGRQAMRGHFKGYKFLYWEKPKAGEARIEQYQKTRASPITVELKPFTEYYFQVLAFNTAGDGPLSYEVGPIRTPEGVPSEPVDMRISDVKAGEATVRWKDPLHANGQISEYILTYFANPDGETQTRNINKNVNEQRIEGLSPEKEYTFKLAAATNAGTGPAASVVFNFSKVPTTKLSIPVVKKLSDTSVILQWMKPNETITGYKVFYWRSHGDEIVKWEKNDIITATIKNLKPGLKYQFQVALYNEYGTGPKSDVRVVETTKHEDNPTPEVTHVTSSPLRASARHHGPSTVAMALSLIVAVLLVAPR